MNLNNVIFLAQSDTTIGFLSKSAARINEIKKANANKILLKEFCNFKNLDSRIPTKFRRFVRYAKKTTFILPCKSLHIYANLKNKDSKNTQNLNSNLKNKDSINLLENIESKNIQNLNSKDSKKNTQNLNFTQQDSKNLDSLKILENLGNISNKKDSKNTLQNIESNKDSNISKSFRVIKDSKHNAFLQHFAWLYSSSANLSGQKYNKDFAIKNADIIVLDSRGLKEQKSSKIVKINHFRMQKIR
ncbi:hypothetical protein DCO58_04310 [Helicobacter saguini]|uniref:Sua5 YciO YrdC YwlC family protein n=1 Tax=Helicobacter saguini TaxID=1548018 RepID=A0A347VVH3_9HELI|nr:hypothetical protein [Helicobacter saguini]MWV62421.1 hypothetical protein [Helicobacter saguini]MWV66907.1 hypothetical protein [Helicobacter saguini]MWV69256.1 hypothetical protein [Helicobacter saguini]MWV71189.1 hypothetical protein [Helicobacter saguini]TLD93330.1 hypothetical protein LS64_008845 [Helicobacter saguini]